ncbi:flavonoid 3',5'-hydroxylase 1-like [Triticum dicoccoides]|uniref:flavonoid 3',5'-hydroxylase 1-like n=1 Tax=Triticum dicoccoides TaxID=85692 RepID=UPI0018913E5A|nr:flavonoid 3',5'-hydroxylase 1-like [Triticum dicoccoides]
MESGSATNTTMFQELLVLAILCVLLHYLTRTILRTKRASPLPLPPGPRGYPVVGALPLLGRAPHRALAALARLHGPIMHLTLGRQGVVVASTPDAARLFLRDHGGSFLDRPADDVAPTVLAYGAQDLVFAPYGPRWRRLRRECSLGLLGPQALADWAGARREEVARMVRAMSRRGAGTAVEVPEFLFCAMANMIGQAVVGRRVLDEAGGEEAREFKEMVVELMTTAGLVNLGDFLPAVAWMDLQGLGRRMRRLSARLDRVWSRLLSEHEAAVAHSDRQHGRHPDLVDRLIACRGDAGAGEDGVTDLNIKALLNNLFTAGTDTSSSTIEWALAEMLANPAILRQAQAEMDGVVGRDRLLEESDVPRLPYLRAICKETFRLHPSTPLSLPRLSTEPCTVQGYHVPKGTRLLVNIWAIGRDPAAWPEPARFDPDRFTTEEGSKVEPLGSHFELIPFGAGRRICAGARMGVALVHHMLGALVHAFDWEMPVPEGAGMDMEEEFGLALQKKVPLRAVVRPRLAPAAYH